VKKINPYILFLLFLVSTLGIGYLLKIVEYENIFGLIGFRFYLPLVIPIVLMFSLGDIKIFEKIIKQFRFQGFWIILVILFIFLAAGSSFYFIEEIKFKEPDFFYELGLSSLIDYPMYLVWNSPLLFFVFVIYKYIKVTLKFGIIYLLLLLFAIITIELFSFSFAEISIPTIVLLIAFLFLQILVFYRIENPLTFIFLMFTTIWITVLLFGSSNPIIVKMVLARNFDNWDGFLKLKKGIWEYLPAICVAIVSILTLFIKNSENEVKG